MNQDQWEMKRDKASSIDSPMGGFIGREKMHDNGGSDRAFSDPLAAMTSLADQQHQVRFEWTLPIE